VAARGRYSLVEAVLETGRKHQIRVHLAGLGCPLIGDPVYGSAGDPVGRLGLHAQRLTLNHPTTGQRLELESPLPVALRRVIEKRVAVHAQQASAARTTGIGRLAFPGCERMDGLKCVKRCRSTASG
jgi:hypothetical protein